MIGVKVMTKNANISTSFFLQFCTKTHACGFCVFCVFVFYVITFVPVKIQTWSAPQNDRLNLSFVKDKNVAGKKMVRYGLNMAIDQLLCFGNLPNLHAASGYI